MNALVRESLILLPRCTALLLLLGLAACAGTEGQRRVWGDDDPGVLVLPPGATPPPKAAQRDGASSPQSEVVSPPSQPAYPRSAEDISSAAVTSLMRQARSALDAGQPAQAAAALERALRIEPRNYFVWSLLGKAYLAQNNFSQADNVAGKSNALARGNVYVEVENWKTIAVARNAMGDAAGADVAQQRLDALVRQLSGAAP